MIRELSYKLIYTDFIEKEHLTEVEKEILDMLLNNNSIVKISFALCMSESVVSRHIRRIKNKYNDYKKVELSKLDIFDKN